MTNKPGLVVFWKEKAWVFQLTENASLFSTKHIHVLSVDESAAYR